jgi:hypothetical protein
MEGSVDIPLIVREVLVSTARSREEEGDQCSRSEQVEDRWI